VGKIVLVRYGGSFRGVKAQQGELRGAKGLIIYSDPEDDGFVQGPVYPDGPWRPADGIQRGSIDHLPGRARVARGRGSTSTSRTTRSRSRT
jgi:N-acetylated-alpha-linked acidic dipeptidase